MNTQELAGLGVLVTRPTHQAARLCQLIAAHGGYPVHFPAMEIVPPHDLSTAKKLFAQAWEGVIYISANAVQGALNLGGLPAARWVAAVGNGTARALKDAGCTPNWVPIHADSEGLLALPAFSQFAGEAILIVRGEGGRALLGDSLQQRGAQVTYAEVYRRIIPDVNPESLLTHWRDTIDVVTATSGELLENLTQLLGTNGRAYLCATPLVVISERMEHTARALGITHITKAAGADDLSLLAALKQVAPTRHCAARKGDCL